MSLSHRASSIPYLPFSCFFLSMISCNTLKNTVSAFQFFCHEVQVIRWFQRYNFLSALSLSIPNFIKSETNIPLPLLSGWKPPARPVPLLAEVTFSYDPIPNLLPKIQGQNKIPLTLSLHYCCLSDPLVKFLSPSTCSATFTFSLSPFPGDPFISFPIRFSSTDWNFNLLCGGREVYILFFRLIRCAFLETFSSDSSFSILANSN